MEFGPFLGALARGVQLDGGGGRRFDTEKKNKTFLFSNHSLSNTQCEDTVWTQSMYGQPIKTSIRKYISTWLCHNAQSNINFNVLVLIDYDT